MLRPLLKEYFIFEILNPLADILDFQEKWEKNYNFDSRKQIWINLIL